MSKKRIPIIAVILIIIAVVLVGATGFVKFSEAKLERLTVQTLSDVDISTIRDGVYTGKFAAFPVAVEVKVTIENHKITAIDLVKHRNGKGKAAEVIPERVVEAQTLNVDIVSGSTYSSKVILKAIEDALNSAVK